MGVHDGRLYAAYPQGEVFAYDGTKWENLGNPFGARDECNQIHSLGVYQGELHAGTWPKGRIAVWRDSKWVDRGRPGDATEVIALTVYNGSFYAGTIPWAEVFRLEGQCWTSVRRLFDPPGFEPVPVGSTDWGRISDWSRSSSLTVFQGRLFASTATCHRTMLEAPLPEESRGKVFAYSTGAAVSYDRDLGTGWKFVAAVRVGKIDDDVVLGDVEPFLGDVLGMDELDLLDLFAAGDDQRAGQAVEVAAGHESHGVLLVRGL
jgi:hypothetical protein